MRKVFPVFCLLVCLGLGTACDYVRPPDGVLESELRKSVVTDDLGREVLMRLPVERAVSLAPSLTEMIFAVGAGDKLVGRTDYCNYPPEARSIASIGDTQTPNIERIVALKPQVVFVSTASQLEAFMAALDKQDIAVYVTDPKNLEDVLQNLRTFGSIFGTSEKAKVIAGEFEKRAKAVDERDYGKDRPNVFLQISREPLFTIGAESFLTEIIFRAGGISVTKDVATGYPKLSKETALAMNPDVIILSDSEDNREPNDVFKNSPAVRNGRVYRINADVISRPGPRLVDALEEIAARLHQ